MQIIYPVELVFLLNFLSGIVWSTFEQSVSFLHQIAAEKSQFEESERNYSSQIKSVRVSAYSNLFFSCLYLGFPPEQRWLLSVILADHI